MNIQDEDRRVDGNNLVAVPCDTSRACQSKEGVMCVFLLAKGPCPQDERGLQCIAGNREDRTHIVWIKRKK